MVVVYIAVGLLSILGLHYIRKFFKGGVCTSKARLDGKTVIVTGSNTGIGKEAAKDLAARGARVILACRDLRKASEVASEINKETGKSSAVVKKLDLSSLASVRAFAAEINKEESRLDVLLNNAGVMWCPYTKTEDGFEMHFGVNHLGHFLLTNLLLDLLKKSAPSRIVNVSSMGHAHTSRIAFDDINSVKSYSKIQAYAQSKLANVLFSLELSRQLEGTGVTANSLHPGAVATELSRHIPAVLFNVIYVVFYPVFWLTMKLPVDGAQTSIHCAVAEQLENVSGVYFSDCAPKESSTLSKDFGVAKKLWEVSAEMVGLE